MSTSPVRWGILGAAQIAKKNWKAICNTGNGVVAAVASRDTKRSRQFIDECQADAPFAAVPRALGSYEALVTDPEIDALYIPLPTGIRKEWVLRAAEAGKHVVCEKPCACTAADLAEMTAACRRKGVQFMDGVMFVHSRRMERLRAALDDGATIGQMRRITCAFSFLGADEDFVRGNIRLQSDLEPLGCLGDLGWYCIRFALWAAGWKLPLKVTGRLLSERGGPESPAPVPTEFTGELLFDGGVSAGFYCSFVADVQQWAHISGTAGHLHVPDFVLPSFGNELAFTTQNAVFDLRGCDFNMESHPRRFAVAEYSNSHPNAQETNLFRTFAAQIQSGRLDDSWPEMALKTQQVMNACLDSARAGGQIVEPALAR